MNLSLNKLNKTQLDAVTAQDKYIRVIAGAGSGKTRVLTDRIVYLIEDMGILPRSILAITFTNKAAQEMKRRVEKALNVESSPAFIATYHAFCVRFLREEITVLDYARNFTIVDDEDQEKILKEIMNGMELPEALTYKKVKAYISSNKTLGITVDHALKIADSYEGEMKKANIFKAYEDYLTKGMYLDFDDLILKTVLILKDYPEIQDKWRKKFSQILVDEFQDTNDIQYILLRLLCGKDTSLFVVGDPDQTIYTWRGANIDLILNFKKDYPGTRDIILDKNYRSTPNILRGANKLIANNKKRVYKDLITDNDSGGNILYYQGQTPEIEAFWVAERIRELMNKGHSYSEFAILYRSNYYSRAFETAFIKLKMPYLIFGGIKFFERKEIKDALCHLRLVVREEDNLAFQRIINSPKRGVGERTIANIQMEAEVTQSTFYNVLKQSVEKSKKPSESLTMFFHAIENAKERLKDENATYATVLENLLEEIGYMNVLREEKEAERIENIKELFSYLFDYQGANPGVSLDVFLQEIALYSAQDEMTNGDYISLMTVHTAKGLEFPYVFVVGMSEGIFPSQKSITMDVGIDEAALDFDESSYYENLDGLEEERRLAYVAFTRAMKQLFITDSQGYNFSTNSWRAVSRFVKEMGDEIVPYYGHRTNVNVAKDRNITVNEPKKSTMIASTTAYHPGDQVEHVAFGEGIIISIEGDILRIAFKKPDLGTKQISKNFAGIHKKV